MRWSRLPFLIFLISCGSESEEVLFETDSEELPVEFEIESTAYEYDFSFEKPDFIYVDTIWIEDTSTNSYYTLYAVQSKLSEHRQFNEAMRNELYTLVDTEMVYVDPPHSELIDPHHSYIDGPTSIYFDTNHISVYHLIDTYSHGGAHHNYRELTFNYSFDLQRKIHFEDILSLETHNDSARFVNLAYDYKVRTEGCFHLTLPFENCQLGFTVGGIKVMPEMGSTCWEVPSVIPTDSLLLFQQK